jgi:transcriptional regulator with XRE-family HTH domain
MAKRGDPAVLRHLVIFLRSHAQMTQEQFGKASRVAQSDVSLYENGHAAPSEAVLRRMAEAAGLDWSHVVHLRQFYSSFLSAAARGNAAPTARALDGTSLEPVLLAVTPYLLQLRSLELSRPSPEEERREAEQIWARLEKHPVHLRRRLIEISPRSGSWALAVQACKASLKGADGNADEALELAELALSIAEQVPGEESWRSRLKGYCWAHVAKARGAADDLTGAGEALVRARELWRTGAAGSDSELPTEERLFDLEISGRPLW